MIVLVPLGATRTESIMVAAGGEGTCCVVTRVTRVDHGFRLEVAAGRLRPKLTFGLQRKSGGCAPITSRSVAKDGQWLHWLSANDDNLPVAVFVDRCSLRSDCCPSLPQLILTLTAIK